jgi:hypothetical protein
MHERQAKAECRVRMRTSGLVIVVISTSAPVHRSRKPALHRPHQGAMRALDAMVERKQVERRGTVQ